MELETKQSKLLLHKSGTTNGRKNPSTNYRVSLSEDWVKRMGIDLEERSVKLSFDGEKIIIEKADSDDTN